jgi:Ni/Co efflux regulator RcnB
MAKMIGLRSTAVASIAALLALAALPSEAMAQDRGRGRWEGNGRGPPAAQSQPRQERRSNAGARPDSGAVRPNNGVEQRIQQGQRMRAAEAAERRSQRPVATPPQAAPQQRVRTEQRNAPNWRSRGSDGGRRGDDRLGVRRPGAPPIEARRTPPVVNNGNVTEARRSRPDGSWNRSDRDRSGNNNYRGARRYEDRDRDGRPDNRWNNDRWKNDRDDRRRYDNARVHSPRWDDDRRWSYSNGRYNWNRDWRSDRRYDWNRHRREYRNVYRPGRYYAPYSSYYYRPLIVGHYLNSGFYGNSYWLSDPWEYRLPAAYGPYRWVRYFDDVLLVNIHNGMVVDVIRNFFW